MNRIDIAERVAAGVAWLDQHQPDWVDRIDLAVLDLGECDECVIGQLYGGFGKGLRAAGISDDRAMSLGFDLPDELDDRAHYRQLTDAWRRLIQDRRAVTADA